MTLLQAPWQQSVIHHSIYRQKADLSRDNEFILSGYRYVRFLRTCIYVCLTYQTGDRVFSKVFPQPEAHP